MGTPVPVALTKRNKIAIVGFASNTRDEAPYKDTSYEIWGLNNLYAYIPRWDRWYETHDPKQLELLYGPEYVAFLKGATQPIYMQAHYPEYPASVALPRTELANRVQAGREFWPSSISYMLAQAIDELSYPDPLNPKRWRAVDDARIGVYGIDLLGDDEYTFQREGCGYLIGVAEGRGIVVDIPEKSSLLKCSYIYGYQDGEFSPNELVTFAQSQAAQYQKKQHEALATVHTYDGASQAFQTMATMLKHHSRGGVVGGIVQPPPKEAA